MKLWIGNIAHGTDDEELKSLLGRYVFNDAGTTEKVEGDGTRPAAIPEVAATPEGIAKVTQRLNGLYWKGRSLTVQAMTR